jgi:hypothetical protein
MVNELKDFYEAIAFAANTTTLFVNFKNINIKFPIYPVKTALNDTNDIERILNTLFYRKQVTWEHPMYENPDWCINSLRDLRDKCDIEVDGFLRKNRIDNKFHFWAILIRTYGSYSDEAYKDIVKSNLTGISLDVIMKRYRTKIYPIITTLLFSLPDGNPIKNDALEKLEIGCKNSKLTIKQILPNWAIESNN